LPVSDRSFESIPANAGSQERINKEIVMKKLIVLSTVLLILVLAAAGCDRSQYAASDQILIQAVDLPRYMGKNGVVILDMQAPEDYAREHVAGAVNYPVSNILVSLPVPNSLAPKGRVASTLGRAGVDNGTTVVIYDEGKSLNASRLWWTLLVYGHEQVKVVSGGLPAIRAAAVNLDAGTPEVEAKEFTVTDNRKLYLASMHDVRKQVDEPEPGVILLDTRTDKEYREEGKIPGSVLMDHNRNFYRDGTFFDTRATRINYIEKNIRAENMVIIYCRTSMRASAVFLRLWDAGYRKLKLYDGAWLEWSAGGGNAVERPSGAAVPASPRDNS
jgi:thiosulfate/3-mercaptopyruvate sulfurtransferase